MDTYNDNNFNSNNPDNRELEREETEADQIVNLENKLRKEQQKSAYMLQQLKSLSGIMDCHTLFGALNEAEIAKIKEILTPYPAQK